MLDSLQTPSVETYAEFRKDTKSARKDKRVRK